MDNVVYYIIKVVLGQDVHVRLSFGAIKLNNGRVADKLCSILLFVPGCKLYYDVIVICVLCVLSRSIRLRRSVA